MLLPELWEIIFNLSSHIELNKLAQVCHFANRLSATILKTRRLNYPRKDKHVKHTVPIDNIENDYLDIILKYLYNHVDIVKGDIVTSMIPL